MAKRKTTGSKRSRTHTTRRKAPSGSRMLRDEQGQFEMPREVADRIQARGWRDDGDDTRSRAAMTRAAAHLREQGLDIEDVDNREVAMAIAEAILDDLVKDGFEEHAYGPDAKDDYLERRGGGRYVHYDGKTGRVASETTVEETARRLFPQAFHSHPYGRWEDAMVEQVRLHDWTGTYSGRRYMDDFERESNSKHIEGARLPPGFMHTMQMHTLLTAEPVWIAQEMVDLVAHARETWPGEPVRGSDAFVPTAFCLLSKPIEIYDGPPNETVLIRAIAWTTVVGDAQNRPGAPGSFWISLYGHADDPYGDKPPTSEPGGQKLRLAHIFQWTWGTTPVDPEFQFTLNPTASHPDDDAEIVRRRAYDQSRTIQTLWRLTQQFVPVRRRAPRQMRRDAKRRLLRDMNDVNVVTLRRERSTGEKGEPTGRHVSVTSLVSGYWGRRHTREGTIVVWVADYLRGQGPYKETKRAWEWRR